MHQHRIFQFFLLFVFILCSVTASNSFEYHVNPECPPDICSDDDPYGLHLVYARSLNDKGATHFVVAFGDTVGYPTLLLLHSSNNASQLKVNYTLLTSESKFDAFTVEGGYSFSSGLILTSLVEFDDKDKKQQIPTNESLVITHPLKNVNWFWKKPSDSSDVLTLSVQSDANSEVNNVSLITKQSLLFEIYIPKNYNSMRNSQLPKLQFNGANYQISFILNKLNSLFANARFALDFTYVTDLADASHSAYNTKSLQSIDDEFTPGAFQLSSLEPQPSTTSDDEKTFFQWKPICYSTRESVVRDSMSVVDPVLNWTLPRNDILWDSAAAALWGNKSRTQYSIGDMQFIFGDEQNFYKAHNYSHWVLSYGLGSPPVESVSIMVILVIIGGLGLPMAIVIFGSAFVIGRKKCREQREGSSQYDRVDEPVINS